MFLETLRTNTVGPALLTQACMTFLDKGKEKKVLNISSTLGSIAKADLFEHLRSGGAASYSLSKTALNMLVGILRCHARELLFVLH